MNDVTLGTPGLSVIQPLAAPANFYLTWRHFGLMLLLAVQVHLFSMLVLALLPHDEVQNIPVRVLNIKLGNSDDPALRESSATEGEKDEKYLLDGKHEEAIEDEAVAVVTALPAIDMEEDGNDYEEALKSFEEAIVIKKEQAKKPRKIIEKTPEKQLDKPKHLEDAKPQTLNKLPKQFVRETDRQQSLGYGSVLGDSAALDAEILSRYEQLISKWIQRFKSYPVEAKRAGIEGEAVVRIRINRNGDILFSRLERPTGHVVLDEAVLIMVRDANPIPRVPENYPAGNLFEFLIPVSFKLR